MKITGFKCDHCGEIKLKEYEVIGIRKEHSIFETSFDFDAPGKCAIHICQECISINIDEPIAHLKKRDRDQWQLRRAELSALFRFRVVSTLENKGKK